MKPRAAAHLRKRAIIDGSYGSFDPTKGVCLVISLALYVAIFTLLVSLLSGGWNPEWDTHKKMFFLRPFRTHIRDRSRDQRAEKITKALETVVPQRIEKYRQEVDERRPVKDIAYHFKRAANLEKGRRDKRQALTPGKVRVLEKKKKERNKHFNMDSDFAQMESMDFDPHVDELEAVE